MEPEERKNGVEEEKDDTAEEELLAEAPSLKAFLSGQFGSAGAAAVVADRTKGTSRNQAYSRGDDGSILRLQQQLYGAIAANQFRTTRAAFVFFVGEDAAQPDNATKDEAFRFISRTGFKVALTALGLALSPHERKALRKSLDGNDNKKIDYDEFKAFIRHMGGMAGSEGAPGGNSTADKRNDIPNNSMGGMGVVDDVAEQGAEQAVVDDVAEGAEQAVVDAVAEEGTEQVVVDNVAEEGGRADLVDDAAHKRNGTSDSEGAPGGTLDKKDGREGIQIVEVGQQISLPHYHSLPLCTPHYPSLPPTTSHYHYHSLPLTIQRRPGRISRIARQIYQDGRLHLGLRRYKL
jgi:hypothetical protein